jgi:hypothetical protein
MEMDESTIQVSERLVEDSEPPEGKLLSPAKLAANRRNAQLSTGPRTKRGKRSSRRNALKHGIHSSVLIITSGPKEEAAEFQQLLYGLQEDLRPVGILEEMMVEKIAVCWWRLQRAVRFESEAIRRASWVVVSSKSGEPDDSKLNDLLEIMQALEANEPSDSPFEYGREHDALLRRSRALWNWRSSKCEIQRIEKRMADFDRERSPRRMPGTDYSKREPFHVVVFEPEPSDLNPELRLPPLSLPAEEDLDRILRYESSIHRQLAFAMNQIERLQRARKGEHVPPPVQVSLSTDQS